MLITVSQTTLQPTASVMQLTVHINVRLSLYVHSMLYKAISDIEHPTHHASNTIYIATKLLFSI